MSDSRNLFDRLKAEIYAWVLEKLQKHQPDLTQATGTLPGRFLPTTGNTGAGYTPVTHAASHEDGGGDALDLGSLAGELTDAQHGDRGGGTLHDTATGSVAGFMSAADKALLDALLLPQYVTLALSGTLTNERRLVAGTNISLTDGGAGGDLTIDATGGGGSGTVTSVDIAAPAAGLTFTGGPITTSGAITAALANDLAALEALSSTGIAARTGTDTWAQRSITGTASRLSVTNGDGVSGNPTLNIDTGYVGQASITTLGTVGTGSWQATKVGLAYGGTNADLSATGGSGQYVKQVASGAAFTVGTIPFSDLTSTPTSLAGYGITDAYSKTASDARFAPIAVPFSTVTYTGLSVGQVPRATGTTTVAFGALDLASLNAVTGILGGANGGTGVNNGSNQLTIPATGTAALLGATQTFSAVNTFSSNIRVNGVDFGLVTSGDFIVRAGTTSTGTILRVSPNGNGLTNAAIFQMYNTDLVADQSNVELLTVGWNNNTASFLSQAAGTGTLRDMRFANSAGEFRLKAAGYMSLTQYVEMTEITAPAAGAANTARLFTRDNGSGKTQLCVIFNTGAIQVIATQP